jgi:glucuronate isomerase
MKVTKCPPGVVPGAGDLEQWALRRMAGKSGVPGKRRERTTKGDADRNKRWSAWVEVTPLFCAGPGARAWERHTMSSEGNGE